MQYNLLWLVWGLWIYLIIHYGVGDQHFYITLKSRWKIVAAIILSCGLIYAVYLFSSSTGIRTMFKRKGQNTTLLIPTQILTLHHRLILPRSPTSVTM